VRRGKFVLNQALLVCELHQKYVHFEGLNIRPPAAVSNLQKPGLKWLEAGRFQAHHFLWKLVARPYFKALPDGYFKSYRYTHESRTAQMPQANRYRYFV